MEIEAELHALEFCGGNDKKVTVHGAGMPFRHGELVHASVSSDVIHITVKRAVMAERRRLEMTLGDRFWLWWHGIKL